MLFDVDVSEPAVCINSVVDGGRTRGRGVKECDRGEALRVQVEVLRALKGYLAGRVNLLHGSKLCGAERRRDVGHDVCRGKSTCTICVVGPDQRE